MIYMGDDAKISNGFFIGHGFFFFLFFFLSYHIFRQVANKNAFLSKDVFLKRLYHHGSMPGSGFKLQLQFIGNHGDEFRIGWLAAAVVDGIPEKFI